MHAEEEQHYAVYTRERVDNATANNPFCIILISLTDTTSRIMIFKIMSCVTKSGLWSLSDWVAGQPQTGFKVRRFYTKLCNCVSGFQING